MTFKQRMWLLPIMAAAIVGVGLVVNARLSSASAGVLNDIDMVEYPLVEALRSLKSDHSTIQELLQQAVSEGDTTMLSKVDERWIAARDSIDRLGKIHSQQKLSTQIKESFSAYVESATYASMLLLGEKSGDTGAAIAKMQQSDSVIDKLLNESYQKAQSDFNSMLELSKSSVHRILTVSIVTAIVTMMVLAIGSWLVIGQVFNTLGGDPEYAVAVVRRIAGGDFTQKVFIHEKNGNSLLENISSLQDKLGEMILSIRSSSESVDSLAHEMSGAVDELSNRTSSQAASLEETASSMEEMTATVKQNADNSHQANKLASDAKKQAESGGDIVTKAVNAMAEINASSKRIADIIGVIDEIAFQTNLLALNAAVEAARAGEQGRGFAVVASEVRSLAQRSATAAREIKTLIHDSVSKVRDGSELVDASGLRLIEIVTSVNKVADIIGDISSASHEQARGLGQVNDAVASLDQVTQQNSAMVSQASGIANKVAQQATHLLDVVSAFKVLGDCQPNGHDVSSDVAGNAERNAAWREVA